MVVLFLIFKNKLHTIFFIGCSVLHSYLYHKILYFTLMKQRFLFSAKAILKSIKNI